MEIVNELVRYVLDCLAAMGPCYKWYFVFIFFSFFLLDFIWKLITPIGEWYSKQDRETQLGWNGTCIAVLHAVVASYSAVKSVFYEENPKFSDLFSPSETTEWQLGFTGGYFLNDITILLIQTKAENRAGFIGHHVFSLFGCALGLRNKYGMWIIAFRLLTELSNPFMNIRILLDMMNIPKTSDISRLNGKVFVTVFVLTRPLMIPVFWGATYYHAMYNGDELWKFDYPSLFFWCVSGIALDYLNVIWLFQIVQGSKNYKKQD